MPSFFDSIREDLDKATGGSPHGGGGGARFGDDNYNSDASIVNQVQAAINDAGYPTPLSTDGIFGPATAAGVTWLAGQKGFPANSGDITDVVLAALSIAAPTSSSTGIFATGSLPNFPGLASHPAADLQAIVSAAQTIGINPDWLAAVMAFESNFSPSVKNAAGSGAIGLIQFMPSTAAGLLGYTPVSTNPVTYSAADMAAAAAKMGAMSFTDQMQYVTKYFAPYNNKLQSLEDTYLAVFYPAFIGKPLDTVLGHGTKGPPATGDIIYTQNAVFDKTNKGYITKEDITTNIRGVLASAPGRIPVPGTGGLANIIPPSLAAAPAGLVSAVKSNPLIVAGILAGIAAIIAGAIYFTGRKKPDEGEEPAPAPAT